MSAIKPKRGIDPANIIEGPRTKRRKESPASSDKASKSRAEPEPQPPPMKEEEVEVGTEERVKVAEEGSKVWQAVREAKDASDRLLSYDFLRLPNKRQYPDYYATIKRPLCLEDIKNGLDSLAYSSLEAIRQDFLTICRNAKRYNLKDSQIWLDARALQKVVTKQFKALNHNGPSDDADDDDEQNGAVPRSDSADPNNDMEIDVETGDNEAGEGHKRKKRDRGKEGKGERVPNLYRSLNSRMKKLMKKHEGPRLLCDPFLELPDPKEWAQYYQVIRQPMCLNEINKKIEDKVYANAAECVIDVDLVFDNAVTFNEDASLIATDAKTLKKMFHDSLKDMPPVFGVNPINGKSEGTSAPKIKIKLTANGSPKEASGDSGAGQPDGVKVKLPPWAAPKHSPSLPAAASPAAAPEASRPSPSDLQLTSRNSEARSSHSRGNSRDYNSTAPVPALSRPSQALPAPSFYATTAQAYETPQSRASPYAGSPHPPAHSAYSPAPRAYSPHSDYYSTPAPAAAPTATNPPVIEDPSKRAVKQIQLVTQPANRHILLQDEIVKAFSVILGTSEKQVEIAVDLNEPKDEDEEKDEEEDADGDGGADNSDADKLEKTSSTSAAMKYDCQLKLNGTLVAQSDSTSEPEQRSDTSASDPSTQRPSWKVAPIAGMNVLEITASPKGGDGKDQIWRVFINKVY